MPTPTSNGTSTINPSKVLPDWFLRRDSISIHIGRCALRSSRTLVPRGQKPVTTTWNRIVPKASWWIQTGVITSSVWAIWTTKKSVGLWTVFLLSGQTSLSIGSLRRVDGMLFTRSIIRQIARVKPMLLRSIRKAVEARDVIWNWYGMNWNATTFSLRH